MNCTIQKQKYKKPIEREIDVVAKMLKHHVIYFKCKDTKKE